VGTPEGVRPNNDAAGLVKRLTISVMRLAGRMRSKSWAWLGEWPSGSEDEDTRCDGRRGCWRACRACPAQDAIHPGVSRGCRAWGTLAQPWDLTWRLVQPVFSLARTVQKECRKVKAVLLA
jgi:hypothetical protein